MSFLFHKRTKKVLNIVWGAIAIIVMPGPLLENGMRGWPMVIAGFGMTTARFRTLSEK